MLVFFFFFFLSLFFFLLHYFFLCPFLSQMYTGKYVSTHDLICFTCPGNPNGNLGNSLITYGFPTFLASRLHWLSADESPECLLPEPR